MNPRSHLTLTDREGRTPPTQIVATPEGLRVWGGCFCEGGTTKLEWFPTPWAMLASSTALEASIPYDTYVLHRAKEKAYPLFVAPANRLGDYYLKYELGGEITYHSPPDAEGDGAWSEPFESLIASCVVNLIDKSM